MRCIATIDYRFGCHHCNLSRLSVVAKASWREVRRREFVRTLTSSNVSFYR